MRPCSTASPRALRLIDPEVRVITMVTGSFGDAAAGREKARGLLEQGADVLVLAAGQGNAGALEEVREHNAYAVGLDADQDALLPGRVLTSILKRADRAVYEIVAAAAARRFRGKEIIVYDLKNGGVGITDLVRFKTAAGHNPAAEPGSPSAGTARRNSRRLHPPQILGGRGRSATAAEVRRRPGAHPAVAKEKLTPRPALCLIIIFEK